MDDRSRYVKRIVLSAVFTALGSVMSPFLWFPFLTTKAFIGQHIINVIAGVVLGPLWAGAVSLSIGVIRNILGLGTIYAFPGGIPGAVVVGLVYEFLKRSGKTGKKSLVAALSEPLGTVLIGGTLSLLLIAPLIGDTRLLSGLDQGWLLALIALWSGWALSSVPGSFVGFIILLALYRIGDGRIKELLFGEK